MMVVVAAGGEPLRASKLPSLTQRALVHVYEHVLSHRVIRNYTDLRFFLPASPPSLRHLMRARVK